MGVIQLRGSGAQHVRPHPFSPSRELTSITGQRSYAKQTVYDAHLSSKKHIKAAAKSSEVPDSSAPTNGNGQTSSSSSSSAKLRSPARLTYLITALLVPLQFTLAETKANVERRFSLTARERETELEEDVPSAAPAPAADGTVGEVAEEPEEEEKIYNPLKLPLGWDGKPIPYWLYKLHGLGVEYRCEICSDHVYMGRKNFERHFQVRSGVTLYGEKGTKPFVYRNLDTRSECVHWVCPIRSTSMRSRRSRMP
jgi:splicing factor 3A subunit 3